MAEIKMSDAMWQTAQAAIEFGKKAGIDLKISDVYNKETAKDLAFVGACIIEFVETAAKQTIEVVKD